LKKKEKIMDTKIYICGHCGESGHNARTCQGEKKPAQKKRKRGGQPGNTNSVVHGFYSRRFLEGEIENLELIEEYNDVSSEIKLVRVALDRAIVRMTAAIDINQTVALLNAIVRGSVKLGHLMRIQELLFGENKSLDAILEEVFGEVLAEFELECD
jgi:hypothetical protein